MFVLSPHKAIGGYFELEIGNLSLFPYPAAKAYISCRAAFYALLLAIKPTKVWMPRLICDSMLAPLEKGQIKYDFYSINENFDIVEKIKLNPRDLILYANYYGLCDKQQEKILNTYPRNQVIIDNSQEFFSEPLDCLSTLYSQRKFFGIPDGGLIITDIELPCLPERDKSSIERMSHLIKRLAESPEAGFREYQKAEQSLENIELKKMSILTESLLNSLDMEMVKVKRNENFSAVHHVLGGYNKIELDLDNVNAPLCYPFYTRINNLKKIMLENRIFIPTYWEDVLKRKDISTFEDSLVNNCNALPIDQRYGSSDLSRMINICLKEVKEN